MRNTLTHQTKVRQTKVHSESSASHSIGSWHPGSTHMRDTLHCLDLAWDFKTPEFRRNFMATYGTVTRRLIQSNWKQYSFYLNKTLTTVSIACYTSYLSRNASDRRHTCYRSLFAATTRDGHLPNWIRCLRVYDSLRGKEIDIVVRVCFDNRDRFSVSMGNIGQANEPCMSSINNQPSKWLTSFWQFFHRWHRRWYEYEILISSCTDNIYSIEKRRGDCLMKWLIM